MFKKQGPISTYKFDIKLWITKNIIKFLNNGSVLMETE